MRRLLLFAGLALILAGCTGGPKVVMPTDTIPAPSSPPLEMKSPDLLPPPPGK